MTEDRKAFLAAHHTLPQEASEEKAKAFIRAQLIRALDATGMTQRAVADKLGVHETRVSKWVNGAEAPSERFVIQMPRAFGVSAHWFLTNEGSPRANAQEEPDYRVVLGEIARWATSPDVAGAEIRQLRQWRAEQGFELGVQAADESPPAPPEPKRAGSE